MTDTPLTFVEEIVLLTLDDATGTLRPVPDLVFRHAVAGALLADLALRDRIDTDPKELIVLSREPTGDPLLDGVLATVAASPRPRPVPDWLQELSVHGERFRQAAQARLVDRGILRRQDAKVLWVFGVRRYSEARDDERREVRTRLAELLAGDDIPDPHDAVLCSLLAACNLGPVIFPGPEFQARADRLRLLARMDLIGREVGAYIEAVNTAIYATIPRF